MTKKQYAICEEAAKNMKKLPEYETLAKASQLLSDGGYWGPEAENRIQPEDINIDALKVQMQMFLKRFGHDGADLETNDFKELVEKVMNEKKKEEGQPSVIVPTQPTETLVNGDEL